MATLHRPIPALFFLCLLLASCGSDPLDVDVSHVEVSLESSRFDQEFFALNFQEPNAYQKLYQTYGSFASDYTDYLLSYEPPSEGDRFQLCENFVRDPYMRQVYDAIQTVHDPRIEQYNAQLQSAFQHLKYHFPELKVPRVVYFHSGFFADTYVNNETLAIGLDYYLGPDHPIVQGLPNEVPQYQREKMRTDYVAVGAMGDALADQWLTQFETGKLLDELIAQGKLMYLLDAAFPSLPDSTKIRYSASDMEWARAHEKDVWLELAHQEVMYGTSVVDNNKWIQDGPWTNAGQIPDTSPSRLGTFMGWQIVRAYATEHPEITVKELMMETNNQRILSAYVPPN